LGARVPKSFHAVSTEIPHRTYAPVAYGMPWAGEVG
jgi:hypothetical protein